MQPSIILYKQNLFFIDFLDLYAQRLLEFGNTHTRHKKMVIHRM